jgi:hypothetical protein
MSREFAISGREDVSRFIVHLTRNDKGDFEDGAAARKNFLSILKSKKILASRPHCLFNKQLEKLDEQKDRGVKGQRGQPLTQDISKNQVHR